MRESAFDSSLPHEGSLPFGDDSVSTLTALPGYTKLDIVESKDICSHFRLYISDQHHQV